MIPLKTEGASGVLHLDAPSLHGRPTAALGSVTCDGVRSGSALIALAAETARSSGRTALVGPMDGDTWSTYRLVVDSDGSPAFLLEPPAAPIGAAAFDASPLPRIAEYVSAVASPYPSSRRLVGVRLRRFERRESRRDLEILHGLSIRAFGEAFLYRPIALARFMASYEPILGFIDEHLVLIAEDERDRTPLGFVFGIPDFAEGPTPKTAILKTYASLRPGLGGCLADAFHAAAHERGFSRVIHALMRLDNRSVLHSAKLGGRVFRRYALWGGPV